MPRSRQAVTTCWRSDARRRRDRDDHLVGLGAVEHARQVVGRAEHLEARDRACPACAGRRRRSRPARCAGRGCGAARTPPAGRRCRRRRSAPRAPRARGCVPRAGRSTIARAPRSARRVTNASVSRKSSAMHAARRVVLADREEEQDHDQRRRVETTTALQDRLEVLLVDEPPELRVEAEQREDRELHRRPTNDDRVRQQLLVAVRDARVEAQDVREVVGEREQARVDADLPEAADVDGCGQRLSCGARPRGEV